jgi:integrase
MMALVDSYLAIRRAAGFKLEGTECRLRSFSAFAEGKGEEHIRITTGVEWAGTACSAHERYVRLCELAIFARHVRAEDPRHEVPPPEIFVYKRHKRLPYIYSDDEIRRILGAAGKLSHDGHESAGDTYRTLLGLLAATGLRIREALRLQLGDVQTDSDRLVVRGTKFRKTRLVPFHPTTTAALNEYRHRWRSVAEAKDPFFVNSRCHGLTYSTVLVTFRTILDELGISQPQEPDRKKGPRIHDLRHTFAVRALEACPEGRAAINKHTLALSTYLGHASVADTYWYLLVTPQLMTNIADACETWLARGIQ